MLQNKEEKIEKIYLILLCVIIVLLHLFVGSSHQEPKVVLQAIIITIGLTYIAIKKYINKKNSKQENIVIKGKIDILMLLLLIATLIPLLLKTYYSLNDTIDFFLAFLCTYIIYILARNLIKTKKELNIVINVTIISSIMIVIFGLDKLYYNMFDSFLKFIDSAQSDAYGMVSTIGYSNTVAVYMTFISFVALGMYLCTENKWIKNLYSSYIQIAMLGFAYGNSRALMLIFLATFMIYIIALKNNKNRLQAIAIISINIITAYIFQRICDKFVTNNLILCLAFILDIAIIYFISIAINKIIEKISIKINKKIFFIVIVIVMLLATLYYIAVKNISKPIEVTEETKTLELLRTKKQLRLQYKN